MKHIFIVNPMSGKKKKEAQIATITEIVSERQLDYEILITKYPKHATELASQYSIKDDVCLYSIGGDGTAYEIVNGLNDKVCLSIVPCGTGNDYYRMICESAPSTFKEQLLEAIDGKIIDVDYGVCNNSRFLNCTTIGLDAEINYRASEEIRNKYLPGIVTYGIAAVTKILESKPITITIETDDETWTQQVSLCAIMNGEFYGGGFNPTPGAKINDGLFDICLIDKLSRTKMMKLLTKYMKGQHTELEPVKMMKSNKIIISSKSPVNIQSDGECFKDNQLHLQIMHKALRLKVPKSSTLN